jgi:hypothetical protein
MTTIEELEKRVKELEDEMAVVVKFTAANLEALKKIAEIRAVPPFESTTTNTT